MKPHLEIEYKTLLTEQEYLSLNTAFQYESINDQTNIYYDDTKRTLFNLGMMCRVRLLDDTFEFTLKIPQDTGVLEYEVMLDSLNLNDPQVEKILQPYISNLAELKEVGRSRTIRKIHSDIYGEWCLDENHFSHHDDYELEYELHEAHPKAYEHYLQKLRELNIEFKKAEPKYLRSLNSK